LALFPDALVRILGYMIDIDAPVRDDTPVSEFGLITEAGTLLHPPHRVPKEMVDVRFKLAPKSDSNSAVWSGLKAFSNAMFSSGGKGGRPISCGKAVAKRAEGSDIPRYFAARKKPRV